MEKETPATGEVAGAYAPRRGLNWAICPAIEGNRQLITILSCNKAVNFLTVCQRMRRF
jgi:hypothetical protein